MGLKLCSVPDLGVDGSLVGTTVSIGCNVLVRTMVDGVERDEALTRMQIVKLQLNVAITTLKSQLNYVERIAVMLTGLLVQRMEVAAPPTLHTQVISTTTRIDLVLVPEKRVFAWVIVIHFVELQFG